MDLFSPEKSRKVLRHRFILCESNLFTFENTLFFIFHFVFSSFPMKNLKNKFRTSDIHDVMEIVRNPSADYDPEPTTLAAVLYTRMGVIT